MASPLTNATNDKNVAAEGIDQIAMANCVGPGRNVVNENNANTFGAAHVRRQKRRRLIINGTNVENGRRDLFRDGTWSVDDEEDCEEEEYDEDGYEGEDMDLNIESEASGLELDETGENQSE